MQEDTELLREEATVRQTSNISTQVLRDTDLFKEVNRHGATLSRVSWHVAVFGS